MLLNCGVGEDSWRVPWTARRSNQSIVKEISPEYSLEELMLKLQYFGPLCKELTHWKRPWCWKRLKIGREGDDRGWDGWMASLTQWIWVWASSESWWWTGRPGELQSMGLPRVGHDTEQLNWTERMWALCLSQRKWGTWNGWQILGSPLTIYSIYLTYLVMASVLDLQIVHWKCSCWSSLASHSYPAGATITQNNFLSSKLPRKRVYMR